MHVLYRLAISCFAILPILNLDVFLLPLEAMTLFASPSYPESHISTIFQIKSSPARSII
jgi:hypothetical protein